MRSQPESCPERAHGLKQRGLVLFFALIALLVLSLAAAALVRSVDTSTIIAGNLAFKQAATTSADAGIEAAMLALAGIEAGNTSRNVLNDSAHAFNNDNAAAGYYSYTYVDSDPTLNPSAGPGLSLLLDTTWTNNNSVLVGTDNSGNTIRYIIQRMCRTANQTVQAADCLFSGAVEDKNGQAVPLPQEICVGSGCPVAGQTPQIRITSRVTGPKNTISYVQAFVY